MGSSRPRLTAYRLLLHLYPGEFQDEYNRELSLTLSDALRNEGSAAGRALVWLQAAASVLVHAPLEHFRRLAEDLRYGVRLFAREAGMTAAAAGMLGLGIGAATLVFTLANAVLLRPLPFPAAPRLVAVDERSASDTRESGTINFPNFLDLRAATKTLDELGVYSNGTVAIRSGDTTEQVPISAVSDGVLRALGIQPEAGRLFTPADTVLHGPDVVILGHAIWTRLFGANPAIVGSTLDTLNGRYTVIGVMPAGFEFPGRAQAWFPLQMNPAAPRTDYFLTAIGRLKAGVTPGQSDREVAALMAAIHRAHPPDNGWIGRVQPLREVLAENYRAAVLLLFGAAAMLLLIACANVSHLLLVRASARSREMAVRTAMGATRRRLLRQLITEGLILGGLGGGIGALLASLGLPVLLALVPIDLPRWLDFSVDRRVLLFGVGISLLTSLGFACLPALNLSRRSIGARMSDAGRATTSGRRSQRLRHVLIVAELAVAVTLLAGASLTARSFVAVRRQALGYTTTSVLSMELAYPETRYPDGAPARALVDRLRQELGALPGVLTVGFTSGIPLTSTWGRLYTVEGREQPLESTPFANHIVITPGYFRTLEIPILRGRDFSDTDFDTRHLIVSRSFADAYFPDGDAIGHRVRFGPPKNHEPWYTIVGVAGDTRHASLKGTNRHSLYLPYGAELTPSSILVRSSGASAAMTDAIKKRLHSVDSSLAPDRILTLEELADRGAWQDRFLAVIFGAFAAIALVLAAVGFYSLLAYAVYLRTHEIGLRMALGASAASVRSLIGGQAVRLAGAGLALGLVAAIVLSTVLRSQLYHVSPIDPVSFIAAPIVFLLAAVVSAVLPTRRALRVDPVVALRHE